MLDSNITGVVHYFEMDTNIEKYLQRLEKKSHLDGLHFSGKDSGTATIIKKTSSMATAVASATTDSSP